MGQEMHPIDLAERRQDERKHNARKHVQQRAGEACLQRQCTRDGEADRYGQGYFHGGPPSNSVLVCGP